MRCFLAIELDEPVRRHLDRVTGHLISRAPDLSWVRRQNWHVTLKFFGELDDSSVARACETLKSVHCETMMLFADRMAYFPRRGPVSIVAAELGGDVGRLTDVFNAVEGACEFIGVPRETRAYRPHITLGRSRRGEWGLSRPAFVELFPGPQFAAFGFSLFQSELLPGGPRYARMATFGGAG